MIEGPVPIGELLATDAVIDELYVDVDRWNATGEDDPLRVLVADAQRRGVGVWAIPGRVFASVSDTETPQGVIALVVRTPSSVASMAGLDGPILVMVDLADPGNAGAAVRAAAAAGCVGVVFAGQGTDPFGPKAVRAAAGAIARLPVAEEPDVLAALDELHRAGRPLVATIAHGGVAPESADLAGSIAVVVGSEAHGLPGHVRERCDHAVTIPMGSSVESINAAMAGAVVLFEAARQRRTVQDPRK